MKKPLLTRYMETLCRLWQEEAENVSLRLELKRLKDENDVLRGKVQRMKEIQEEVHELYGT